MEIICFHNPDEENGYLSNWYESKFIVDHVKFSSMEQFMMYQKAITFQDQTIALTIANTILVSVLYQSALTTYVNQVFALQRTREV